MTIINKHQGIMTIINKLSGYLDYQINKHQGIMTIIKKNEHLQLVEIPTRIVDYILAQV